MHILIQSIICEYPELLILKLKGFNILIISFLVFTDSFEISLHIIFNLSVNSSNLNGFVNVLSIGKFFFKIWCKSTLSPVIIIIFGILSKCLIFSNNSNPVHSRHL